MTHRPDPPTRTRRTRELYLRAAALLVAPCTLVGLLVGGPSQRTSGPEQAGAKELEQAVERVQDLAGRLAAERAVSAEARAAAGARRDRLESDLRELRAEVAEARDELRARELAAEAARSEARAARESLSQMARVSAGWGAAFAARTRAGVPGARRLASAIEAHVRVLEAGEPEERVAAVRALLTLATEKAREWRRRTIESALVEPPGTDLLVHARVARLGAVGEWFLGESEEHTGVASRDGLTDWSPLPEGDERRGVVRIVEALRGLRQAGLERVRLRAPVDVAEEEP